MIMYCNNCGKHISDDDAFCPSCGARVAPSQSVTVIRDNKPVQPATVTYETAPAAKQTTVDKSNMLAVIGFIMAFFVPIAGLVCSVIGYKNSKAGADHKGLAVAGIVISSLSIAGTVLYVGIYLLYCVFVLGIYGSIIGSVNSALAPGVLLI